MRKMFGVVVDGALDAKGNLAVVGRSKGFWVLSQLTPKPKELAKLKFEARSVTFGQKNCPGWWALGKNGEILNYADGRILKEKIEPAGTGPDSYGRLRLGYVNRIAFIEDDVYVCGVSRQMYKRDGGKWALLRQGFPDIDYKYSDNLESLHGLRKDYILTVGNNGEIWRFDGKSWSKKESPTDSSLNDVLCVSDKEAYACGGDIALHWDGKKWNVLENQDGVTDLWGAAKFKDKVIFGGYAGFAVREGSKIKQLQIGDEDTVGYRLRADSKALYSIGDEQVFSYDGKKYTLLA